MWVLSVARNYGLEGLVPKTLKRETKKKFSSPVLVQLSVVPEIWQLGFVTQNDLEFLGLEGYFSVYCPKSYGFLGELIIVKAENIKLVDGKMNSSEVMKFVVSGGVAADADDIEE